MNDPDKHGRATQLMELRFRATMGEEPEIELALV